MIKPIKKINMFHLQNNSYIITKFNQHLIIGSFDICNWHALTSVQDLKKETEIIPIVNFDKVVD